LDCDHSAVPTREVGLLCLGRDVPQRLGSFDCFKLDLIPREGGPQTCTLVKDSSSPGPPNLIGGYCPRLGWVSRAHGCSSSRCSDALSRMTKSPHVLQIHPPVLPQSPESPPDSSPIDDAQPRRLVQCTSEPRDTPVSSESRHNALTSQMPFCLDTKVPGFVARRRAGRKKEETPLPSLQHFFIECNACR
jgi:hypothetical protein